MKRTHKIGWVLVLASSALACGKSGSEASAAAPAAEEVDPTLARMRQLKEAAQRVQAEREKRREALRAVADVKLTDKKLIGKKGSEKIELEFELMNNGDKPISLAEGTIVLSDASGKPLRKLKIPFTEGAPAHKSASKRGKFPLDAGSEEDHAFVKLPLKEIQTEWIPSLYRYADGSSDQGE